MTAPNYDAWIAAWVAEHGAFGRCKEAVAAMREAFPELREARGYAIDGRWGMRAHWWCVAPDGAIVDPTAGQFPMLFDYEEWEPGKEVCVGKCMNCGEQIWKAVESLERVPTQRFCSESCENEVLADFNGGG